VRTPAYRNLLLMHDLDLLSSLAHRLPGSAARTGGRAMMRSWLALGLLAGCMGDVGAVDQPLDPGALFDQTDESDSPETIPIDEEETGDPPLAYALVGHKARVTAQSGLHLRTGPSTSYAIILTMPDGAEVNVIGVSGGWNKVTYAGRTGWASATYLHTEAPTGAGGTAVDAAIMRAQSGVRFSYHWGGGCWDPGSTAYGACYGNCPNCTHAGRWGADCSGYLAKVWQVPGSIALTTCSHPYSTYNFRYTRAHWSPVARSSARRGDALVHHENGAGHIFLFESGDGWGWMRAYEAKGCSYGIQHDTRMASRNYIAIRRNGF